MHSASGEEYWTSPSTKSRLRILVSTAETNGELLKIEFENQPDDIAPPYHLHPDQEEAFTVIEGCLSLRVDGEEHELGPGERIVAPRNAPHTFWNAGTKPVRFTSEHRPAHGFEGFITSLYDLDYDGRSNAKGAPPVLQLMALLKARKGEQFVAGPPQLAQLIGATVLGTIGGVFGYGSTYVSARRRSESF